MHCALLITALIVPAVTGQDSAAIKELLRQTGTSVNESQLQMMAKEYQGRARPGGKDTAVTKADTTAPEIKEPSQELSVYEKILRNKIVDPDSLLKTLAVFGIDVFKNAKATTFAPENYLATPADYAIGAGDEINILLWGRINEQYRLKVDRDGRINIPHLGPVPVAGMPFSAMQKNILDRIQSIEGVQASVTMGELRSISVFIVGEVKSPGMYTVSSLSNVTNALFAVGGPSKRGSLRNIQLKRNGNQIATIDFYDFLLSGKKRKTQRIREPERPTDLSQPPE